MRVVGREGWFEERDGGGGLGGAPLSRLGVILQLGMCWRYQGARADHHSRPERLRQSKGIVYDFAHLLSHFVRRGSGDITEHM